MPRTDDMLLNELAAALAKAQGAMNNASMNRINPHFKSKYADLAALWDAVRKPLSDNGLSVVQIIRDGSLHTMLLHTSGQRLCSDYPLPATARPQEMGSALTYARRYSLSALVGIAADEDDDANAVTQSAGTKQTSVFGAADAAPPVSIGSTSGAAVSVEAMAREAAMRGEDVFREFYRKRSGPEQARINAIGDELRGLMDGDMPDDHTEHMKRIEAFKRGQVARSAGHKRQALPVEYREDGRAREGLCWTAGFDGSAMPEFGTDEGER